MNKTILHNGSEIAAEIRSSSGNSTTSLAAPATLADLLAIWADNPPRQAAMLGTTCARLADYHGAPPHEVTIDAVDQKRKGFRLFLEGRRYSENSIRTYVNHIRILLNYATAAGWKLGDQVSEEWRRVIAIAAENNCAELARHVAANRKQPREVTPEDVEQWVQTVAQRELSYDSAVQKRSRFWRILRDLGYDNKLPSFVLREKRYGISLSQFPPAFREEVLRLLKWKESVYVWDRPNEARHRPPTLKRLRQVICAVYGYVVNIRKETSVACLSDLAQPHIIGGFVEWCMNEREVKGQTLQRNLRLLAGLLNQHPSFASLDRKWLKPMLDNIPTEPKSVLKKRKAKKYLPYETVQGIPAIIHAERAAAAKRGPKQAALVVRNELLMFWLTVLAWRQRNLRECRIGGPTPNLYRGPVPPNTDMDLQPWAIQELQANPAAEFWQFHFTEEETKTGCAVDALLARHLIKPLEEYLHEYRGNLLTGPDPHTLFLNESGKPLSRDQVTNLVSKLTLRHGGVRVTPHLYRDIFAYAYLKERPKDFLMLSKIFWHATPKEVIATYGGRFDESSGVCGAEAWLDEREARRKD
jgi:hypothetical protein